MNLPKSLFASTLTLCLVLLVFAPLRAGLVSHWPLDGSLADIGPANEDLEADSGRARFIDGVLGPPGRQALGFSGVADALRADGGIFSEQPYSIAFWVRGGAQPDAVIYTELGSRSNALVMGADSGGGRLRVQLLGEGPDAEDVDATTRSVVFNGEWRHVVWVDDGEEGFFFIDGARDPNFYETGLAMHRPVSRLIARSQLAAGPCCWFAGGLDDFRIYDHALSSAEISSLFAAVCPPVSGFTSAPASLPEPGGEIRLTSDSGFDPTHSFWFGESQVDEADVSRQLDGSVLIRVSGLAAGSYDVSVRCRTASPLATIRRGLTIVGTDPCAPDAARVDSVTPSLVLTGRAQRLEIRGSGFHARHITVTVGGRALSNFSRVSSELLVGTLPAMTSGVYDLNVFCDNENIVASLADAVEVAAALSVQSILPDQVSVDGGTEFAVTGFEFRSSTRVFIGDSPLRDAEWVRPGGDLEVIRGYAPPGLIPGLVDVRFADPRGDLVFEDAIEYVFADALPGPMQIEASLAEGTVRMAWQTPMPFESVELLDASGRLLATVAGDANEVEVAVGDADSVDWHLVGLTEAGLRSRPEYIYVGRKDCDRPPPLDAIQQEIRGRFEGLTYEDAEFSLYGSHSEAEVERCSDPDPLLPQAFAPPPRTGAMAPGVGSKRSRAELGFGNSETTTGFVLEEPASRLEIALHYRKLQVAFGVELRCRIAKVGPEPGFVDEFTFVDTVLSDTNDWHVMTYFRADSDVGRELIDEDDPGPMPCPGPEDCVALPLPAGEYTLTFYATGGSPAVAYYSVSTDPDPDELLIPQTPCPPYPLVRVRDTTNEDVLPFVSELDVRVPPVQVSLACPDGLLRRRISAVGYTLDECNQVLPLIAGDSRFEYRFTVWDGEVPTVSIWSHRNWIERCLDCGCYRVDVEARVAGCPSVRLYQREITILPTDVPCDPQERFAFLYPQPSPTGMVGVVGLNDFSRPIGTRVQADPRPLDFSVLVAPNCECTANNCRAALEDEIEFELGVPIRIFNGGQGGAIIGYTTLGADLIVEDSLCRDTGEGPKYFRVRLRDVGRIAANDALDDFDPTEVFLLGRTKNLGEGWQPIGGPMKLFNPPEALYAASWRSSFMRPNCYFFSVQTSEAPEQDFDMGASSDINIDLPELGDGETEPIDVEGHPDNNMCTGFTSKFSLDNGVWSDEDGVGGMRGSMMGNDVAGAPLQVGAREEGSSKARRRAWRPGAEKWGDGLVAGMDEEDDNRLPEWEWCSGGNIFNYEFEEDIYKGVLYTGTIWVIPVTVWASIGFGFFFNVDYQLTFQLHPFSILQGFQADCPDNVSPGNGVGSLADAYMYLLATAGISIPASVRADIFFGVMSIALTLEPEATLAFTPWLEAHANARVETNPPNVEFDPTFDIHMYLDARFKLFAKMKACIFWELECIEIPENAGPIINQPIFTCEDIRSELGTQLFDCLCPSCIEVCEGEDPPSMVDCEEPAQRAADGQPAGFNLFNVHAAITIPQTTYSPDSRRTLDVWMSAEAAAAGVLNIRESQLNGPTLDLRFTLDGPNPYFLDPAIAYITDDVALIAFTETLGTLMEDVPALDLSNADDYVAVSNRNAARANIRVHALTPDIRALGSSIPATQALVNEGNQVSEDAADIVDWRADGSASMVGTPATQSAWLAWVRYEDEFLENRGTTLVHVPCDDCPNGEPYTVATVPDIQPNIESAAIYVRHLTHDPVDGVIPVPGSDPMALSTSGINIEPELAALPAGDLVACAWVHDGLHANLVDDNRGRNVQFAHWTASTGTWTAPVPVIRPELVSEYPGVLEPKVVLRRRNGTVDGLLAFTSLPSDADPNDTGLGGLRYLNLVRFAQQPGGDFAFEDPVRLRGACNAVVYAWDYVLTIPIDDILVDPGEAITKHGPDWVILFNQRGVPGTQASSGDVMVSVLGQGQSEWTAPVCISDSTRVISNVSGAATPTGEIRSIYLDGGASRFTGQGIVAGGAPRGVQAIETSLRPDLALASCRLSQQFPGPGARIQAKVRVENRGMASSAMDSDTGENLAGVEIVYHEADGSERVVASEALLLLEPGASQEIDFLLEMPHDPVQLEARIVRNVDDLDASNDARRCDFGAPEPEALSCVLEAVGQELRVIVEWDNPVAYDEILVYRDGLLAARLAGQFERFVDIDPELGLRRYEVRGCVANSDSLRVACEVFVEPPPVGSEFRRGDANSDGRVDISDPSFVLVWLFLGGVAPSCRDAADGNDNGTVDISDPVFVLNWLFLGGLLPPAPGPIECGVDETDDTLPECVDPGCA